MSSHITIKCSYNRTIKRITVRAPRNFQQLQEVVEMLHGVCLSEAELRLTYIDEEGDQISLTTDMDVQEALRVSQATNNLLKLQLREKPQPRRKKQSKKVRAKKQQQQPPQQPQQASLEEMLQKAMASPDQMLSMLQGHLPMLMTQLQHVLPMLVQMLEAQPHLKHMLNELLSQCDQLRIEQDFDCDHCDTAINGTRYHCETRDNFDLCSSCYEARDAKQDAGHRYTEVGPLDAILHFLKRGGDPMLLANSLFLQRGKASDFDPQANVRHRATCDVCEMRIVGPRYRSLGGDDWDACHKCFTGGRAKHAYPLHKIATVSAEDRALFEEALTAFQQARLAEEQERRTRDAAVRAQEAVLRAQEEARLAAEEQARLAAEEQERRAAEEQQAASTKPLNAFERNLDTLASMGFSDRALCIRLLVKNKNQLFPTIQELLN